MNKLITGLTGMGASIFATPLLTDGSDNAIINAVVQVVIALATLIGLFRKKK